MVCHKLGRASLADSSRSLSQRSSYITGLQSTSRAVTPDYKDDTREAPVTIHVASAPGSLAPSPRMQDIIFDSQGPLSGTGSQLSLPISSPLTPTPNNVPRQAANSSNLGPTTLNSPLSPPQFLSSSSSTPTTQTLSLPPENASEKNAFGSSLLDNKAPSPERTQVFIPPCEESSTSKGSLGISPSPNAPRPRLSLVKRGSRPLSTASTASTISYNSAGSSASTFDLSLFSTRPAPPSPGGSSPSLSRTISMASTRSIAGSNPVSRANSLRKQGAASANGASAPTLVGRGESVTSPHNHRASVGSQLSQSFSLPSLLASPNKVGFDMGISSSFPSPAQDKSPSHEPSITIPSGESSASPSTMSTSTSVSTSDVLLQPQQDEQKVFIKICDFAFQTDDERFQGLGPLVPKSNRVGRMNRRLRGRAYSNVSIASSVSSSDGDGAEEEVDADGWWGTGGFGGKGLFSYGGWGNGFKMGTGRFSWTTNSGTGTATAATIFDQEKAYAAAAENLTATSNGNGYPSRSDMDLNFLDSESEEFYDAEMFDDDDDEEEVGDGETEEEPLYPGLYRAVYAFEPEGTAEMRLVEDQIVRVVGRGGGVGWAIVVADQGDGMDASTADKALTAPKHALVPESYLEPYKLDWELEQVLNALDVGERHTDA